MSDLSCNIFNKIMFTQSFSVIAANLDIARVMEECDNEAEFQGKSDELGTSDISCMARSVLRAAGGVL